MAMSNPLNRFELRIAIVEALKLPWCFRIRKKTSVAMTPKMTSVATWDESPTIMMLFPTETFVPLEAMTAPSLERC